MKKNIFYIIAIISFINVYPVFAQQKAIPGHSHSSHGPTGVIKDISEMERSPLNIKYAGPPREAGEENNDEEKEINLNNYKNLYERARAKIFKFDESKHVTVVPSNLEPVVTTKDPATTFLGNQQNGWIPSDAEGAAGPAYIVAMANGDARIIKKLTGQIITDVTLDAFFGLAGTFDPRIFYDPFGQRFVALALSGTKNCGASTSVNSVLRLLVSNNSDPTQGWYFYDFDFDANNQAWIDFGIMGFNKDWIVVSGTSICGSPRNALFAFPKPSVYAAAGFTYYTWAGIGKFAPAFTYDNFLDREYLVGSGNSNLNGVGYVDSKYITGNPPVLFGSNSYGTSSPWQGNVTPGCPTDVTSYPNCGKMPEQFGSNVKFSFVQVFGGSMYQNCVYRNGSLWFTHPIMLPATGTTNRTSTQWWQVNPATGGVQQVGRIDDPSGTVCTFYPSIAVNSQNDAVISYCIFSPNYYQSAAYNFRNASDPVGHVPHSSFYASGGNVNNSDRTGDYGETVVDPNDDNSIWAINQISSSSANFFNTEITLLPAYYGCYTDVTFGNNNWLGNTKNEASNSITSQERIQINSNVVYSAGNHVTLSPGFSASAGCLFHAYIAGCGGSGLNGGGDKAPRTDNLIAIQKQTVETSISGLHVYPNPASSELNLSFNLQQAENNLIISVYDAKSQSVKEVSLGSKAAGQHTTTLDLKNLSSGIYMVVLKAGTIQMSTKVALVK